MTLETKTNSLLMSNDHPLTMNHKDSRLGGFQIKMNDVIKDDSKQVHLIAPYNQLSNETKPLTSIIAILRRHTMYDSLILVKKYRAGLGEVLEFPTSTISSRPSSIKNGSENSNLSENLECRERLVTIYLDGDDPMLTYEAGAKGLDLNDNDIVHVPLNGLRTRLENYEKVGLSVDICVQAYAIGLKNAERFFRSSSMKEIQETP